MSQPSTPIYGFPLERLNQPPGHTLRTDDTFSPTTLGEAVETEIARMDNEVAGVIPVIVVQDADESNATTTVTSSSYLVIPVLTGLRYIFQARITYAAEAGGVGGPGRAKFRWDVPPGTTMNRTSLSIAGSNTTTSGDGDKTFNSRGARSHSAEQLVGGAGITSNGSYWEDSVITVGGTGGNAVLQFALNNASADPAILRAGSFVTAFRVP